MRCRVSPNKITGANAGGAHRLQIRALRAARIAQSGVSRHHARMSIREHPDAVAFKTAAERYCALFESEPADADRWVEAVLPALAQVYAAAHRLPDFGLSDDAPDIPDSLDVSHEDWRSLFG